MTNPDDADINETLPSEIEDLYREKFITSEEVKPMLNLRHDLVRAAPQPREGFQKQLAQRLQVEFEQQKRSARGMKLHKRFTVRFAITVIAVLTIGVGAVLAVNAILQQFIGYDAGLNAVFTAGSGIELNQSQTVGNYTVNLEWANADSNRLTIGFTVSGFTCTTDYVVCDISVKVFDQSGREIPLIDGRADDSQPARTYLYNFDLSSLTPNEAVSAFQFQVTPYGMTNEGPDPDQPGLIRGHTVILGEPITLNFSVPMSDEVRVYSTPQSATDENITLTLRRVTVSPSQTRVAICFVPPTSERRWTTIPRLTTDGAAVVGGGTTDLVSGIGESSGEICNEHIYNAAMFDYTGNWQLEITELIGFGSSGDDKQRIAGSWVFQFQIP
jgi:hypothetical protein